MPHDPASIHGASDALRVALAVVWSTAAEGLPRWRARAIRRPSPHRRSRDWDGGSPLARYRNDDGREQPAGALTVSMRQGAKRSRWTPPRADRPSGLVTTALEIDRASECRGARRPGYRPRGGGRGPASGWVCLLDRAFGDGPPGHRGLARRGARGRRARRRRCGDRAARHSRRPRYGDAPDGPADNRRRAPELEAAWAEDAEILCAALVTLGEQREA